MPETSTSVPADLARERPLRARGAVSGDAIFRLLCALCAAVVLVVLAGMVAKTTYEAWPVFRHSGLGFLTGHTWFPTAGKFGALPFIYGTMVTSTIAILLAVPVAVMIALFLTDVAPRRLRLPLAYAVDLLAAVPSVVYGLWGVFVLVPFLADHVWQPMSNHLGFVPLFADFQSGRNFATAGVILALMIVPIISAICREVFLTVPRQDREAALALGATRWEMLRVAVLPRSRAGVVGAVMLGFGRAVGETIAVAYLIGGNASLTAHLFQPGWSIASVIASQFNEAASNPEFRAALVGLGVVLFAITLVINMAARLIIARVGRTQ
ncbi:MAG: phosphate ABC transporter permease subunit PstC [Gaiellales bacterium]